MVLEAMRVLLKSTDHTMLRRLSTAPFVDRPPYGFMENPLLRITGMSR